MSIENAPVLIQDEKNRDEILEYISQPYQNITPENKIKRNPKGYDYVKGSYMDMSFKQYSPLYSYDSIDVQDVLPLGFVRVAVILRNRITGNTEVGTGAARIQLTRDARKRLESGGNFTVTPFDVVDYDKNLKSATEQARKNAQRQFGIASDVYRRREFEPTNQELERWEHLKSQMSLKNKLHLQEEFENLGSHFTEWLDEVESNLNDYVTTKQTTTINKSKGSVL
jgi:hypothetical protein